MKITLGSETSINHHHGIMILKISCTTLGAVSNFCVPKNHQIHFDQGAVMLPAAITSFLARRKKSFGLIKMAGGGSKQGTLASLTIVVHLKSLTERRT